MKEKILQALKVRYKNLSLNEAVFVAYAASLEASITEESQIENAISGLEPILKSFRTSQDRLNNEKVALEKKLKEIEEAGGTPPTEEEEPDMIPNPKKKKPDDKKPADKNVPDWAKGLIESNKVLAEKLSKFEEKETHATQAQKIAAILKEKNIDPANKQVAFAIKGKVFKDDAELEAFAEEVATTFEEIAQASVEEGFVKPGVPVNGKSGKGAAEEVSSLMKDHLKAQKELQKKEAENKN